MPAVSRPPVTAPKVERVANPQSRKPPSPASGGSSRSTGGKKAHPNVRVYEGDISKIKLVDDPISLGDAFEDYTHLLYGPAGVGKSLLFAQYPDPYFIAFEPINRSVPLRQNFVSSWKEFIRVLELLEQKGSGYCSHVIIDTGWMCYQRAWEFTIKQFEINHPREEGWAAAWKYLDKEFIEAHIRIARSGFGFGVTAHSEEKDKKDSAGNTTGTKIVTQLGGQASRWYGGMCDMVSYMHYQGGKRFLRIRSDGDTQAKAKTEGNFLYTNGKEIDVIPMGNSPKEAYEMLRRAFNNELVQPSSAASVPLARKGGSPLRPAPVRR
jgi:hypothetical protein